MYVTKRGCSFKFLPPNKITTSFVSRANAEDAKCMYCSGVVRKRPWEPGSGEILDNHMDHASTA